MPKGIYPHLSAEDRFWSKVERTDNCWNWKASKKDGYGLFRYNNKTGKAYRFAYELLIGEIPKDKQIDHLCRNHSCVNPQHLEVVSQKENIRRGFGVGVINAKKTHCPKGHEYSGENTGIHRGQRYCKHCHRERELIRYHQKHSQTNLELNVNSHAL